MLYTYVSEPVKGISKELSYFYDPGVSNNSFRDAMLMQYVANRSELKLTTRYKRN